MDKKLKVKDRDREVLKGLIATAIAFVIGAYVLHKIKSSIDEREDIFRFINLEIPKK